MAKWAPGGAKKKWHFIHQTLFLIENEHRTQMFHSMGPKTGSEINFVSQLGSQKLSLYSSSKRSYCIYFEIKWSWNEVKDTRQFEISQCQFWLNVLISDKWSVRRRIWNFVEMEISLNFWGYFLVWRGRHRFKRLGRGCNSWFAFLVNVIVLKM